jgi:pimeloyl-ACP methyl ester carboxylesterase
MEERLFYYYIINDRTNISLQDAPESLENYSYKQAADNIKALADQLGLKKIILGGHDW